MVLHHAFSWEVTAVGRAILDVDLTIVCGMNGMEPNDMKRPAQVLRNRESWASSSWGECPEWFCSGLGTAATLWRITVASVAVAALWPGWTVFAVVAKAKPARQHAAFHARIAGAILDMLTSSIEFMGAAPAAHRMLSR